MITPISLLIRALLTFGAFTLTVDDGRPAATLSVGSSAGVCRSGGGGRLPMLRSNSLTLIRRVSFTQAPSRTHTLYAFLEAPKRSTFVHSTLDIPHDASTVCFLLFFFSLFSFARSLSSYRNPR